MSFFPDGFDEKKKPVHRGRKYKKKKINLMKLRASSYSFSWYLMVPWLNELDKIDVTSIFTVYTQLNLNELF